ncbi:MAG: hypothetical protein CTY12_00685 [Methylotenera sp.]|nr:MAG: hypothetical protein CTY12_00685 [Methylotenera sp.]
MASIIIKLAPQDIKREMYGERTLPLLQENISRYVSCSPINVPFEGEDAAEEAFDLTNNPSRQTEREQLYGRGPSVSVGDVIDVDGVNYACLPFGWQVL